MLPRLTVSDNSLRLLSSGHLQLLYFADEQNYWIRHISSRPHFRTQIRILFRISCLPVIGWLIGCTAEEIFLTNYVDYLGALCRYCYRRITSPFTHTVYGSYNRGQYIFRMLELPISVLANARWCISFLLSIFTFPLLSAVSFQFAWHRQYHSWYITDDQSDNIHIILSRTQ